MITDLTTIPKKQIFEYFRKGAEMEATKYYIEQQIADVDKKIFALNTELNVALNYRRPAPQKPQEPIAPTPVTQQGNQIKNIPLVPIIIIGIIVVVAISFLTSARLASGLPVEDVIGMPIGFAIVFIIITITIGSSNKKNKQRIEYNNQVARETHQFRLNEYKKKMEQYELEYKLYEEACAGDKAYLKTFGPRIQPLQAARKKLEGELAVAKEQLEEFYSAGIIHPKYQGIVPIFRFYEYYDTGSCDTVKECMNKYDNELFQNMVVLKLDQLIGAVNSLQYYLSEAVSEISGSIMKLSGSFEALSTGISAQQAEIAAQNYSNAMLAESAKRIADNTDTLRFYRELEWIKNY